MEINGKVPRTWVFLLMLGIMILAPVIILSNYALAQTPQLHNRTLYEVVKQTSGLDENTQIDVGDAPVGIAIADPVPYDEGDKNTNTVYVANRDSNTVSVISGENNTKIGEDIPVGQNPSAIGVINREFGDKSTVYVVNIGSLTNPGSVSVISGESNTKIGEDIPVGQNPSAIGVNQRTDIVYVANFANDTISVISGESNTKIGEDIPVGESPIDIAIDEYENTVYVANSGLTNPGSVSVISGKNYTKIKDIPIDEPQGIFYAGDVVFVVKGNNTISVIPTWLIGEEINIMKLWLTLDLPFGSGPEDIPGEIDVIYRDDNSNKTRIYVANSVSNTVSVISIEETPTGGLNFPRIDIPVGETPYAIGVNQFTNAVYVANRDSNTVSVISGENNTKIGKDIPVGENPLGIAVNEGTNTIYIVNHDSDSISVIDGTANRVVTGVILQVNPSRSGYIECDGLTFPSAREQYTYLNSGAQCIARPNPGFEFVSWEENLRDNSTQLIKISNPASPLDSIADFLRIRSEEPESKLDITRFGTFTANFRELPPAIPSEYWIPLYGIIISTIVGWSIPSIIGWTKSKRDVRKLTYYHKQIASLYGDGKLDENDIGPLDRLRTNILDAYSEGKINDKHYESLRNETSILYEKIFRKRIDDVVNKNNDSSIKKPRQEQLDKIRKEVKYAYSEGKINDKHYDLLNKDILDLESKERDNTF